MFDLTAWSQTEKPKNFTYTIKGVSDTALLVQRSDKASTQSFTKTTFADLLKKGKLTIVDNTTFTVERDENYNPADQFKAVDLG